MYLNCHSYYSFLYGTMKPKDMVAKGKKAGAKALVLTDINNTSGWYDFLIACKKEDVMPILGVDFRHESVCRFIAIAKNNDGICDLNKFLSEYSASKVYTLPPESENLYILYPFGYKQPDELRQNEFTAIRRIELNKLFGSEYLNYQEKLVALCPITFKEKPDDLDTKKSDFEIHQALRSIEQNTLLSKLDTTNIAKSDEYFTTVEALYDAYKYHPYIIDNTEELLSECSINLDLSKPKNKKSYTGSKTDDKVLLEKMALEGYTYRYGHNQEALDRVHKELRIIDEMDFAAYYLITWDLIQYASNKGIHHVGRGSGANSIIAYCIQISNVDPIMLDLYFERFINPYRISPPDFDVDFSWDERDEVISYIFRKYGKEHVCLLATYNTFQDRSIIREIGKSYGLPKNEIDILVEEKDTAKHHEFGSEIFDLIKMIEEFPNHLSIHAGGILITEEPLYYYTALEMMPKGFPTCQFDMHVAEAWGFYKYDILSQRGLGHIKEAVDIVWKNRNIKIDVYQTAVFFQDPLIRQQLLSANTIGCFYIESPAMRGLLTKLKCDNFNALVAASSIIRPGVAKSGMMREYITRANNPDKVEYIHPKFKEVLDETYGVMVYQEDVIKIAHRFGGLDMGEADILRRGMSGKSRTKEEFRILHDKYYENCKNFGYSVELAKEVWRQIESFSGFSFCKAHSASYAVESYQSLFLKTYYPLEFMVAVINNFGGFYHTENYVHEARISGAKIEAPCVNESNYKTCIKGIIVYLGFIHIQGLENEFGILIVREREKNGPYLGLKDFIRRTGVKREQLNLLVRIGALRFTGKSKQILLWEKNDYITSKFIEKSASLLPEFDDEASFTAFEVRPFEDEFDQMEILGFPLCSPFDLLRNKNLGEVIYTEELKNNLNKIVRMAGYFVAKKDTRTSKGELMNFGTWVDSKGRFFDTVHFPPQLKNFPFTGKGCYLMLGKIVHDFNFPMMEVQKMKKLPMINDPRY